jgi:drug/metabolite transporter (DMT)-like permease
MNAVALGLGAALGWGAADVLARFATRALGAHRALLYSQLVGLLALTAYAAPSGELRRVATAASAGDWLWGIAGGLLFTAAALAFYKALETGLLALVSPITGSYAALTVALSLLSGETLTASRAVGITAALAGVVLASMPPPDTAQEAAGPTAAAPGVRWALAAALGFGLTFWLVGFRATPALGGVASVWTMRATSVAVLLVAALTTRASVPLPPRGKWGLLAAVGVLDTAAFLANNIGTTLGLVSVVSVLGSLFSAVTVLVAWAALGERLGSRQWVGVALVLVGVAFVSA